MSHLNSKSDRKCYGSCWPDKTSTTEFTGYFCGCLTIHLLQSKLDWLGCLCITDCMCSEAVGGTNTSGCLASMYANAIELTPFYHKQGTVFVVWQVGSCLQYTSYHLNSKEWWVVDVRKSPTRSVIGDLCHVRLSSDSNTRYFWREFCINNTCLLKSIALPALTFTCFLFSNTSVSCIRI